MDLVISSLIYLYFLVDLRGDRTGDWRVKTTVCSRQGQDEFPPRYNSGGTEDIKHRAS